MVKRLNQPVVDDLGRKRFGGHTPRVAGARHLARIEVPTPVIMLLARCGYSVVLRYIAETPLTALTKLYRQRLASASREHNNSNVVGISASESEIAAAISNHLSQPLRKLRDVSSVLENLHSEDAALAAASAGSAEVLSNLRADMEK